MDIKYRFNYDAGVYDGRRLYYSKLIINLVYRLYGGLNYLLLLF